MLTCARGAEAELTVVGGALQAHARGDSTDNAGLGNDGSDLKEAEGRKQRVDGCTPRREPGIYAATASLTNPHLPISPRTGPAPPSRILARSHLSATAALAPRRENKSRGLHAGCPW